MTTEKDVTLTEAERELLSGLCDSEARRGPGEDGYCYAHHAPVKWQGRANASDVCCVDVEDYAEQLIALRLSPGMSDPIDQWWCINGAELMAALARAHQGDEPGVVYLELIANSATEENP